MQPGVQAATATAPSVANAQRGHYGDCKKSTGVGGILLMLGLAVGVYALSPGARHFYKHGYLPPAKR